MKMGNTSLGAIMMCLQKGILEQCDITELLRDLDFENQDGLLECKNPPTFTIESPEQEETAEEEE